MTNKEIRVALFGGQEVDLQVLGELYRQDDIQLLCVYDRQEDAVGLEIAEILGIRRVSAPGDLDDVPDIDYVVVSEPRARFAQELKALTERGARILTPASALEYLCRPVESQADGELEATAGPPFTIDDTLRAVERLLDRGALLRFLLEVAVKATDSATGSIMLYSSESKELYIGYATGLSERVMKYARQKVGEGIAGGVALSKQARLIQRPREASLYGKGDRVGIGSAISVPLMWENQLLGVLNVSRGVEEPALEARELERMKSLSRRLSRVLYESQKIQAVQVRHREERLRATMGELAEQDMPSSRKFSLLARYLGELVDADTVDIYVNTQEGDWFVLTGSNRLLSPTAERVRVQRGTLGRAFLEDRCIILTEATEPGEAGELPAVSSVVYCPLSLRSVSGVMTLEFSERYRLDEFLAVRETILSGVGRFVASEMREHKLRRELRWHGRVADAAPALLACQSLNELAEVLCRVVMEVTEAERASVRLRPDSADNFTAVFGGAGGDWTAEDNGRFERWIESPESVTMAYLDFEPTVRADAPHYRSMVTAPIATPAGNLLGAITAYDKHPVDPMDDAIFGDLDEALIAQLAALILPVIDAIRLRMPQEPGAHPQAYDAVLAQNLERLRSVGAGEISRSERYHTTFTLVLFRIEPLAALFETDAPAALALVDEITQGLRTRTRKTDFGTWIDRSTWAMLTLDGGKRIRFLISRALLYLHKDLSEAGDREPAPDAVLVGTASYPGSSRDVDELIHEAEANLEAPAAD